MADSGSMALSRLYVGHCDPTYIPKNPLVTPGLSVLNGPVVVGGQIDGQCQTSATALLNLITPATTTTSTVPIPTGMTPASTAALQISALGDGATPYPGIGLNASALIHNIIAGTSISVTSPTTTIKGSLVDVLAPTYVKTLLNINGIIFVEKTAMFGKAVFNESITANGTVTANGSVNVNGALTLTGVGNVQTAIDAAKTLPAKPFDIPHPSKENHRLRHISLEGPEIGVFYRGKSKSEIIELPDYWVDLVHEDSITVSLTPVGSYQHLYVQSIKDNKITVGGGLTINGEILYNYHYTVFAERKDLDKLIVEYEGESPKDYPGQDFLGINNGI